MVLKFGQQVPKLFISLFCVVAIICLSIIQKNALSSTFAPNVQASASTSPQGGTLVVGTNTTTSNTNSGSWKGILASDNVYWTINRALLATSLDVNFQASGVNLYGANKIIITIEDTNITTATAYIHQICDWVSTTNVDNAADAQCTGGGWRTLNPLKTTYTNTADTTRNYEVYDGYFWNTAASPGTVISTPLTNFVQSGTKKVMVRTYSTINIGTQYNVDFFKVEVAIDPFYEPAAFTKTAGGTTTNSMNALIGAVSTNVTASDNTRMTVPMSAISTAIDTNYTFKNVKNYTGANTILVSPELCVSNAALTLSFYLFNYNSSTWTQIGTNFSPGVCGTDTDYAFSFNSTAVPGFTLANYISGSGDVQFRILSNAPGVVYNYQIDKLYMQLGSVNTNTADCEISFGTGSATNCSNTRQILEAKTATPTVSTWQATAALEYPSSYYSLDNDDDATAAEYATSQNLSFPVTLTSAMSVTGIHYAVKYRSNSTTQTMDLGTRDYSGTYGTSGWAATPGTDSNALTTYSWFDTWNIAEVQINADKMVDTVQNKMNLRARTSAGTTTNPGTRDWAFALMSIRWIEDSGRSTLSSIHSPSNGTLITGNQVATDAANTGSWKGTLGNDSATNGASNYWTVARTTTGLDAQLQFDNVELYGANKMIVRVRDSDITTADAYVHQICDWNSSAGVDNSADTQCTGGGWRTLHPLKTTNTNIADTTKSYNIYDGYFWNTSPAPGSQLSTPLSNFIQPANKRVLIRFYSTVNSTTQLRIDFAQVEVGIDPVYEPAAISRLNSYSAAITNAGNSIINTTGSDNTKMTFTNAATNPVDVQFSMKNVKTYSGENTILVRPEVCVSNVATTFNFAVYNFTTTSWTNLSPSAITGTACATDTTYSLALNNITLTDYIQSGELRVRMFTATSNVNTIQLDRLYVMLGSTNTDTAKCEISFGTGTATDCSNTRDVRDADAGASANTSTWQQTSVLEYPAGDFYSRDNDGDATNAESATSSNVSVPVTPSGSMSISGILWATRIRSNIATMTAALGIKENGSLIAANGWTLPGFTNALTTYTWGDSYSSSLDIVSDPVNHVLAGDNTINLRFATSASTAVAAGTVRDLDFAMASIRYVLPNTGLLYTDMVDNTGTSISSPSLSFSTLSPGFSCQTSTATLGTSSAKIRIYNTTSTPTWTVSLASSGGSSSVWNSGGNTYDFNDSTGSGCTDGTDSDSVPGQLSLDFSSATITPQAGCSATGITFGSNSGFTEGTTDSLVIAQASGSAQTGCYWDITGITVNQKIQNSILSGNYALSMNLSAVTN